MINKLISKIKETNAPIVVGLDPMLSYIPNYIKEAAFKEFGETLEGESIPLLYANVCTPIGDSVIPGLCAVYQISNNNNTWSATLINTITVSFVGDSEWGTLSVYDLLAVDDIVGLDFIRAVIYLAALIFKLGKKLLS